MRIHTTTILLVSLLSLLLVACGPKTDSTDSDSSLPWSRVKQVEVTTDASAERQPPDGSATITTGASQSQIISAWGIPDYILDSPEDPQRKIWQYSHAIVVFQGTRAEKVIYR